MDPRWICEPSCHCHNPGPKGGLEGAMQAPRGLLCARYSLPAFSLSPTSPSTLYTHTHTHTRAHTHTHTHTHREFYTCDTYKHTHTHTHTHTSFHCGSNRLAQAVID